MYLQISILLMLFCKETNGQTTTVENRTLTITAKSTLYDLYVDGVRKNMTIGNNWTITDEITLSPLSRLIAVMAIDSTESCAGILGSVTGDYLVTDGINWRCHYIGDPQFFLLGWDDSSWPLAYVVGPNNNVTYPDECRILTGIPTISPAAYWIWTDIPDTPIYHSTIYCRGYLPLCELESPCLNGGTCNKNNETLCTCLIGYVGEFCETVENRTLSITVKTTLYDLYVDGVKKNVTNFENWTRIDEIPLSPLSRLIAVMAIDSTETCAGIIGSVSGDYLVTDGINWRCHYIPDPMWFRLGWDDSEWDPAYVVGPNNNVTYPEACKILTGIPTISPAANWIWTDSIQDTPVYHMTVYCRGYLPLCELESPCFNGGTCNKNNQTLCTCLVGYVGEFCETVDTKVLTVTAKESIGGLYVDGAQVSLRNGSKWLETDTISISSTNRVIAIVAHQLNNSCIGPGILASVTDSRGDYVVTNASWKCSPSAENGWSNLGYDDSTWQPATLIKANSVLEVREAKENSCQEVPVIPTISLDAFWIWTARDEVGLYEVVVFCRGYLPICNVHPCKNGGICNPNSINLCTCQENFTGRYCEIENDAT